MNQLRQPLEIRKQSVGDRLLRWFFRIAKTRILHGVRVAIWSGDTEELFTKMSSALELLRHHDPRAMRMLQDNADGIFVFGTSGVSAEWSRDTRLILLQEEYVSDAATSAGDLAATLVHEVTHARLERLGIQYETEIRAKIESICCRRALRFARRLPDESDLVTRIEEQLKCDPEYLSDDAFRQRTLAELERLGVPKWLLRILEWRSKMQRKH